MMSAPLISSNMTSLSGLVNSHWGRSSNFLLGINYNGSEGDIWTSLALKKEIGQRTFSIPAGKVDIEKDLFNCIPSWVKNFKYYEDYLIGYAPEKPTRKDIIDFIFVGDKITKLEFYFIFANSCIRNSSAFFFKMNHRQNLPLNKFVNLPSGRLYIISRSDFNQWIDQIHEVIE